MYFHFQKLFLYCFYKLKFVLLNFFSLQSLTPQAEPGKVNIYQVSQKSFYIALIAPVKNARNFDNRYEKDGFIPKGNLHSLYIYKIPFNLFVVFLLNNVLSSGSDFGSITNVCIVCEQFLMFFFPERKKIDRGFFRDRGSTKQSSGPNSGFFLQGQI